MSDNMLYQNKYDLEHALIMWSKIKYIWTSNSWNIIFMIILKKLFLLYECQAMKHATAQLCNVHFDTIEII